MLFIYLELFFEFIIKIFVKLFYILFFSLNILSEKILFLKWKRVNICNDKKYNYIKSVNWVKIFNKIVIIFILEIEYNYLNDKDILVLFEFVKINFYLIIFIICNFFFYYELFKFKLKKLFKFE